MSVMPASSGAIKVRPDLTAPGRVDDVRDTERVTRGNAEELNGFDRGRAWPESDSSAEIVGLLKLRDRREPAVARIATAVALDIVEGRLKPGGELNSVELSQRFHCSRTPVREALMLLESEGLVEMPPRKRSRVVSFTRERINEIYQVRKQLLSLMGLLVVERLTDEHIADLRQMLDILRQAAAAGDVDAYFWGHVRLQDRLLQIAGNETLAEILDSLALRTLVLRHASLAFPGRLQASFAAQVRIFDALEERDAELTAMLLNRATEAALGAIDLDTLSPVPDAGQ